MILKVKHSDLIVMFKNMCNVSLVSTASYTLYCWLILVVVLLLFVQVTLQITNT